MHPMFQITTRLLLGVSAAAVFVVTASAQITPSWERIAARTLAPGGGP